MKKHIQIDFTIKLSNEDSFSAREIADWLGYIYYPGLNLHTIGDGYKSGGFFLSQDKDNRDTIEGSFLFSRMDSEEVATVEIFQALQKRAIVSNYELLKNLKEEYKVITEDYEEEKKE